MAAIHRLPETLVNQIAAGEVVERPAAVVKELCENAIDAGADQIDVLIEEGGTRLIEVSDDGVGMAPEDACLSLERHATSKLSSEAQLSAIGTLGFRGEALPAIASVSHFTLTTRPRGALAATRLTVAGGAAPLRTEVGAPEGTRIAVADLFFNTPARRKFLKKPATEGAQVAEVVTRLSLSRPELGFSLTANGRRTVVVTAQTPLRDRVALALGRETFEHLVEVDGGRDPLRITGYAGGPDISASTSQKIQLFVNGRAVRDRSLQHAVGRAYANLLPPGRYPVAVLFIALPLDQVDVNVHPQKNEVRFADPRALYEAVSIAVGTALRPAPWLQPSRAPGSPPPPAVFNAEAWGRAALVREPAATFLGTSWGLAPPAVGALVTAASRAPDPGLFAAPGYFAGLRYLGQIGATYLVCEGPQNALVVLDQHAAHERVLFEELRAARRGRAIASQRLLVPAVIELGAAAAAAVGAHREQLAALGFEVEAFGGESFAVAAVPAVLARAKLVPLLTDLAEQLAAVEGTHAAQDAENDVLATVACHAAIRAGDPITAEEVTALLRSLDAIDFKVRCPHGRPVVTTLSIAELARRVDRR